MGLKDVVQHIVTEPDGTQHPATAKELCEFGLTEEIVNVPQPDGSIKKVKRCTFKPVMKNEPTQNDFPPAMETPAETSIDLRWVRAVYNYCIKQNNAELTLSDMLDVITVSNRHGFLNGDSWNRVKDGE